MADYIADYCTHLRTIDRAASTIDTYAALLRHLDRELPYGLASACAEELRDAIGAGRRSAATRALYRAAVREFFKWAADPDAPLLDYDPSRHLARVKIPRRAPRSLNAEQLADILARARDPYLTWYLLGAYAGLRCIEIANLDREHVDQHSMWIQGKGSHERVIPTAADVWAAVEPLPPGPVARRPDGLGQASRRQVMDRGNHHLRVLGFRGITMHRFRHTFAQTIYDATGDIELVRALLGHASVRTTQVYAHAASPAMVAAVAALPRLMPASADAPVA